MKYNNHFLDVQFGITSMWKVTQDIYMYIHFSLFLKEQRSFIFISWENVGNLRIWIYFNCKTWKRLPRFVFEVFFSYFIETDSFNTHFSMCLQTKNLSSNIPLPFLDINLDSQKPLGFFYILDLDLMLLIKLWTTENCRFTKSIFWFVGSFHFLTLTLMYKPIFKSEMS